MDNNYYQIEEVAAKTGLTKRALRYYEDMELIDPVRTEGGYRLYTEEDIEKIRKIKDLKGSLGFTLNDIKSVLDLEKELKDIFSGRSFEREFIEKCAEEVQQKIQLIESKEIMLQRVKAKYNEILSKLLELKHDR